MAAGAKGVLPLPKGSIDPANPAGAALDLASQAANTAQNPVVAYSIAYSTLRLSTKAGARAADLLMAGGKFVSKYITPVTVILVGKDAIDYYKQQVDNGQCGEF